MKRRESPTPRRFTGRGVDSVADNPGTCEGYICHLKAQNS